MRILFMGTPAYAVTVLEGLAARDQVVLRVVTRPDAPAGRGRHLRPSPVAAYAVDRGLSLDRPVTLKAFREAWTEFRPDLVVTAAYGRILPGWLIGLGRRAVNLHASLLPRWRGPNPIAWAIWAGDTETGVTLMEMAAGVDTGPILAQAGVPIGADDTLGSLTARLAETARDLLLDRLDRLFTLPAHPQDDRLATWAPKFAKEARRIDWTLPASVIDCRIRSMTPEPGAYTTWQGERIEVAPGRPREGSLAPGHAVLDGEAWMTGTGNGLIRLEAIRPAGKRWMTPAAFLRGRRNPGPVVLG